MAFRQRETKHDFGNQKLVSLGLSCLSLYFDLYLYTAYAAHYVYWNSISRWSQQTICSPRVKKITSAQQADINTICINHWKQASARRLAMGTVYTRLNHFPSMLGNLLGNLLGKNHLQMVATDPITVFFLLYF